MLSICLLLAPSCVDTASDLGKGESDQTEVKASADGGGFLLSGMADGTMTLTREDVLSLQAVGNRSSQPLLPAGCYFCVCDGGTLFANQSGAGRKRLSDYLRRASLGNGGATRTQGCRAWGGVVPRAGKRDGGRSGRHLGRRGRVAAGALVVMVGAQIAPSNSFTNRSCHVGSGAMTGRQAPSAYRMAVQSATRASATSKSGVFAVPEL